MIAETRAAAAVCYCKVIVKGGSGGKEEEKREKNKLVNEIS